LDESALGPVVDAALGGGGGGAGAASAPSAPAASAGASLTEPCRTAIDATSDTIEQAKRSVTVCCVDSCPFIQSIVVVTSPIGVQTPPALAAITIMAPNSLRSSISGSS
jgi:hypothetical protein